MPGGRHSDGSPAIAAGISGFGFGGSDSIR